MDRRAFIGASEVAAVCGLSPFMKPHQLFLIKTGQADEVASNIYTTTGDLLEPVIIEEAARRGIVQLDASAKLEYAIPDTPIVAHPDAMTVDGEPVEVKAVGIWARSPISVPDYYSIQVQVQAVACGAKRGHLIRLIGGAGLFHDAIQVNEELMAGVLERVKQFWDCVQSGKWNHNLDEPIITQRVQSAVSIEPDGDLIELAAELAAAHRAKAEAEERWSALRSVILSRLTPGTSLKMPGVTITVKEVKRQTFDSRSFAASYPELYSKFKVESCSNVIEVKEEE